MHDIALITATTEHTTPAAAPIGTQIGVTGSDDPAALAHDARNLITALGLYCDLLEEPGVLAPPFAHYGNELRLVVAAGRRLVSKLGDSRLGVSRLRFRGERVFGGATGALETGSFTPSLFPADESDPILAAGRRLRPEPEPAGFDDGFPASPIRNLAAELMANRNLLAALAGPGIALTVDVEGGALGVPFTAEDLTRILVNLVKNAAEAMPAGGRIRIGLAVQTSTCGQPAPSGVQGSSPCPPCLQLTFEDNGPGISPEVLDRIFDRGFTTRGAARNGEGWAALHRGLGLAITRSIVESAGGSIQVSNRPGGGALFLIELPAL